MRNIQSSFLHHWFQEVWNNGNRNAIDNLLTDDVLTHGLSETDVTVGKEAFKQFYDGFKSDLTDIHVEVQDVVGQDDMETARCLVMATHVASNKPLRFTGICAVRLQDGRIAEAWNEFNFLAMYQQMGYNLAGPMAV